jgi:anthranilate phosphoribosyltransferase
LQGGEIRHVTITPGDAGIPEAPVEALAGGGPEENAAWLVGLLEGNGSPAHADAVALNAGALAWATGTAPTLRQGTRLARQALDGGSCVRRLSRLVEVSHGA